MPPIGQHTDVQNRISLLVAAERACGWIHVHENLRVAVLTEESERVRAEVQALLLDELGSDNDWAETMGRDVEVSLDHVEKVKSYSPGVMHVVLDVAVRR